MTEKRVVFQLLEHQVPSPPISNHYRDLLRWCVMVMDDDDDSLNFAASLLAQCINRENRLTGKQIKWADRLIDRVVKAYNKTTLDCQEPSYEPSESRRPTPTYLEDLDPEGTA